MESLSDEYGWTPNQIKQLTVKEVQDYLYIINTKRQIEEAESKKKR